MFARTLYILLAFVALLTAQEYCQYGRSALPWDPYRCPSFLQNVTNEARTGYATLVNNRTVPWGEIKKEMIIWGRKNIIQARVQSFIGNVSTYMKKLSNKVTKYLGEEIVAEVELDDLLVNDNITEHEKYHSLLRFFLSQEPRIVELVRAYTDLGQTGLDGISTSSIKAAASAQRNSPLRPCSQYLQSSDQYGNTAGYYNPVPNYNLQGSAPYNWNPNLLQYTNRNWWNYYQRPLLAR